MRPKRNRYLVCALIIALAFGAVFFKLYDLQIASGADYVAEAEAKTTKTMTLTGMRGTIYDANMIPLAYDKRAYNVMFYRDPSLTSEADRRAYTQSLIEVIRLIESNGKKTIGGLWLQKDEEGKWRFDSGTENEAAAAKREAQWRQNFYLDDVPEEQLFDELCKKYFLTDAEMSEEDKIKVLSIWQEQRMNNYLSKPIVIAYGVDFETVSEIEVRSMDLLGISVEESSTRIYPKGSLAAHSIGYIGKISGEETMAKYKEKGYPNDAVVGQTGIEYSMEDQLSPYIEYRQGERVVEVNNRGKVIRQLSYGAPTDGNDVIMTIDTQLQAVAEQSLEKVIETIRVEQEKVMNKGNWKRNNRDTLKEYEEKDKEIQLAQSGAIVAMDPNSGRVLAMASYPTFDLSMFTGTIDPVLWNELVTDVRNPMYNRAISTRDTPGSIFKLCTALGGLMEGAITLDTEITDAGYYTKTGDTSRAPSCWVGRANRYKHANQTVIEGLKNSCNYFFYEVGFRMKSDAITKWAAQLGLTSKTGIELPNESTSFVGNQLMLYDGTRAIDDQYTSKPYFSALMIKKMLRRVGADRGIEYDEERLDQTAKKLLDLVLMEGTKEKWNAPIRQILLEDMNIPSDYIQKHYLGNEVVSYLNDLRWTDSETIMAAIGQSITQVTPIAVARYASAIVNGGTVYDAQIIDKVVSPTGAVVLDKDPVVVNQITGAGAYLAAIQEGMKEVTSTENDGTAAQYFAKANKRNDYIIAAKTGTSQRTDLDVENNSWLITYAPWDDPQIVVIVYVQNGYAGAQSSPAAIKVIEAYMDMQKKTETATVATTNRLAE